MRKMTGIIAAMLCVILAWAATPSETVTESSSYAPAYRNGKVAWAWYKGLKDAIDKYLPEEKQADESVVTDFQLKLDETTKTFKFFIANYGTQNKSNKLGYRYLTKSGEYKDVVIWTADSSFVEPHIDYECYEYDGQTSDWQLKGTAENDSIIGTKLGIRNGVPILNRNSGTDNWKLFLNNLNSNRENTGAYSFNVTYIRPGEFSVTLPADAASTVIQLFIQNNGGKAYSMSDLNAGNDENSRKMCSAMHINYEGNDYTFFGFEDWFGNADHDLNDVVIAIATDGDDPAPVPDIVDNDITPKGIQTVTNTVKLMHTADGDVNTLFYGTTFTSTIPQGQSGLTPVSRLVVTDAEGNTVYTSAPQTGIASTDGNSWNALPDSVYLSYDLSKIKGLMWKVETTYLNNIELASTSTDWNVLTAKKKIYSSAEQPICNTAVKPEITITGLSRTPATTTSTSLDAKVNWSTSCTSLPEATKAVNNYTINVAEDTEAEGNTASAKLGTPDVVTAETDANPATLKMPLKSEFGTDQKETLSYSVTGEFHTAVATDGTTGYFFSGVDATSTEVTADTAMKPQAETLTAKPRSTEFATGVNVKTSSKAHNIVASGVNGGKAIYYGSDFSVKLDETKINSGMVPYTRLKLVNKNDGSITYPGTATWNGFTLNDGFTKASDEEIANMTATSYACYNIDDKDNYQWEMEVIYLTSGEAEGKTEISATEAEESYDITESGLNDIENEQMSLDATISVPRYHYVKGNTDITLKTDIKVSANADLLEAYKMSGVTATSTSLSINSDILYSYNFSTSAQQEGTYNFNDQAIDWTSHKVKQGECDTVNFTLNYSYSECGPKSTPFASMASVTAGKNAELWNSATINATATDYGLWIAPSDAGMMSRVSTNYFNSQNNIKYDDTHVYRKYMFTELSTNSEYEQQYEKDSRDPQYFFDGNEPTQDTNLASDNEKSELTTASRYPAGDGGFYTWGLDLKATVMSDVNTYLDYNAVILVHDKDGNYATDEDGNIKYYIVNGHDKAFNGEFAAGAADTANWWRDDNGTIQPAIASGLNFAQVGQDVVEYSADIYLVYGNSLTSISDLTDYSGDKRQYQLKFTHTFIPDRTMTSVDIVNGEAKTVKSVTYYNLAGIATIEPTSGVNIKVTTYTDGSSKTEKVINK